MYQQITFMKLNEFQVWLLNLSKQTVIPLKPVIMLNTPTDVLTLCILNIHVTVLAGAIDKPAFFTWCSEHGLLLLEGFTTFILPGPKD